MSRSKTTLKHDKDIMTQEHTGYKRNNMNIKITTTEKNKNPRV